MAESNDELYRAMGRVEGELASLIENARDERARIKEDHLRIIARLEVMEEQLSEIIETNKSMQSQVYSNKHGIEGVNKDLQILQSDMSVFKLLYSKGLGALAVLSLIASLLLTGVWWALWHWSELSSSLRAFIGGK